MTLQVVFYFECFHSIALPRTSYVSLAESEVYQSKGEVGCNNNVLHHQGFTQIFT